MKNGEAFLRVGHGIIVFPGGVGTLEILYLLGVLLPDNIDTLPVVFTGPASSADYFRQVDAFIRTQGERRSVQIIIDDPEAVATLCHGIDKLTLFRRDNDDAFYFNWRLTIPLDFQSPFEPTHAAMAA